MSILLSQTAATPHCAQSSSQHELTVVLDGTTARGREPALDIVRRNRTGRAIIKLMSEVSEWEGTASALLKELVRLHPTDRRLAVQSAGGLGQHLSKLKSTLSSAGLVQLETDRVGHNRTRTIYLTTIDRTACAELSSNVGSKSSVDADAADEVLGDAGKIECALNLAIASVVR
jgi:hypothetical protein